MEVVWQRISNATTTAVTKIIPDNPETTANGGTAKAKTSLASQSWIGFT